jgi:hypothetical protein
MPKVQTEVLKECEFFEVRSADNICKKEKKNVNILICYYCQHKELHKVILKKREGLDKFLHV